MCCRTRQANILIDVHYGLPHLLNLALVCSPTAHAKEAVAQVLGRKWKILILTFHMELPVPTNQDISWRGDAKNRTPARNNDGHDSG
jgi:hypothetical protein